MGPGCYVHFTGNKFSPQALLLLKRKMLSSHLDLLTIDIYIYIYIDIYIYINR